MGYHLTERHYATLEDIVAVLLIVGIPAAILYAIAHRSARSAFGDHRPDIVRKHGMTPMQAHLLGYPAQKRRR